MKNTKKIICTKLAAIIATTAAGFIPHYASAQLVLEEVVVTARKREESLQETPIAVTALSGDKLSALGLADMSDLRKIAPNVDVQSGSGNSGVGSVFIRGVGARNTGVNFDAGVGIYVDGVYLSRPDGAVLDNIDLQSVQVLRGPQGTLFGKNTTGGAILYTTNKPSEEFEGHAEARLGNFQQVDGKLTVNVPINDTLMSRFSVYATTRDGYTKAVSNGRPGLLDGDKFNDVDRRGAQAQLRWVASDELIVDTKYEYAKTDQTARVQDCRVVDDIEGSGWQADLQDAFIILPSTGQTIAQWCEENNALGRDKVQTNLEPNIYQAETHALSVTAEWDMTDSITLKSITALREVEGGQVDELDAIGIPLLERTNFGAQTAEARQTTAWSQEFQFAGSAFDDKLDYVAGIYGFTEESDAGATVGLSGPFFGALSNPLLAFYTADSTGLEAKNTSASVFSQADWNFSDAWRLTVGLRYTWEERKLRRQYLQYDLATVATTGDAMPGITEQFVLFPGGIDTFNPNHGFVPLMDDNGQLDPLGDQSLTVDNDDITPMISLQYTFDAIGDFVDGGTVYATASNGFLSGGVTDTISVTTGEIEEFEPEEVWNYELGVKLEGWNGRLRANMAAFYSDYKDRQLTTISIDTNSGRISGALINAKSSSIAGIELETQVIPIENLQITANITINKGDIEEYDDERILSIPDAGVGPGCLAVFVGTGEVQTCPIDRSDENLPRLPDEIFFLSAQYFIDTEFGQVVPSVSYSLRTDVDNCFDRSSCLSGVYANDQEDVAARLSWISQDGTLRVTAYGNNLTNERYSIGGVPLIDVTQAAGFVYNLPRTYGVELAYDF